MEIICICNRRYCAVLGSNVTSTINHTLSPIISFAVDVLQRRFTTKQTHPRSFLQFKRTIRKKKEKKKKNDASDRCPKFRFSELIERYRIYTRGEEKVNSNPRGQIGTVRDNGAF